MTHYMKRLTFILAILGGMLLTGCKSDAPAVQAADVPAAPYAVFEEGLIADIEPQGWLLEMLERQRDGLTGHPEAMAYPYDSPLWAGELKRDSENRGADWWRYEQTAYYLDGLARLGYILDDENLLAVWNENINYVLDHPLPAKKGVEKALPENFRSDNPAVRKRLEKMQKIMSAGRPEGRLGADANSMAWPLAVFFRAAKACYEATGDERIPAALEKNWFSFTVEELGSDRGPVNVEGILWTYAITGNPELLKLAEAVWAEDGAELTQENCLDDSKFNMHGVTMNELLKVPMLLYAYTGKPEYLQAALNADAKMEKANMLVDGVNSSSEHLAGNDALASHETCDVTDYAWTMGYFLTTTGDSQWADRIEKSVFNAGMGAITKDFRSMQYFSCPNQFIATGNSDHNGFKHGLTWMAYRPIHETECCIGNVHRFLPNYVSRMWLKDTDGEPVAALYGPSTVVYDLGDGITVEIEERTDYPFGDSIDFVFTFYKDGRRTKAPVDMDFTYRVPGWCSTMKPGFVTESREWKSGDVFSVEFPMEIEVVDNPVEGKSIVRGPLVYSYAIPMDCVEDTTVYENLAGKVSGNPDFKSWSMTPSGKWNYALVDDLLDEAEYVPTSSDGFPFDLATVHGKIRVPVVGVKGWELEENRYTPALPDEVVPEGETSWIELVPYGSTTLRLTVFPVAE